MIYTLLDNNGLTTIEMDVIIPFNEYNIEHKLITFKEL